MDAAARTVRSALGQADVGLVLGSGLGGFASCLVGASALSYAQIPGLPVSAVSGHAGKLWLGRVGSRTVACLQGRVHAYEGHDTEQVVFGVCLLAALGCRTVLLSNAAGGINTSFNPGTLMLVSDHLNLTGRNPLVGPAPEQGPRFPDMSFAYDLELQASALRVASEEGIELASGVYAGVLGPSYETPAEIRMLRSLGADAVGMSTVLETIALRQLGVRVGAVSCITNLAAGLGQAELSHDEVKTAADSASSRFNRLFSAWLGAL